MVNRAKWRDSLCTFLRISERIDLSLQNRHIPTYVFAFCNEMYGSRMTSLGLSLGGIIMPVAVRLLYKTISLPITHSAQAACSDA
jgi:hypothetical protein